MRQFSQNLRYAVRQLRSNPGFTATVIVTLALAIGVNTSIFSIVNALMLKSLPYSHPERIGTIFTQIRGATATDERHHIARRDSSVAIPHHAAPERAPATVESIAVFDKEP